jgi:hypothetical protein
MNLEHTYRELRQCERDLAYARARLADNPADVFARRWLDIELAHRDRVHKWLALSGVDTTGPIAVPASQRPVTVNRG